MNSKDHMVFVVDDDPRVGEALSELLSSLDLRVAVFSSAREYIAFPKPDVPTCLILDVRLPDVNGLDLQGQLADQGHPPIVFITGHGDIPSTVRAMKAGAVDFLPKPFGREQLLRAIEEALVRDTESRLHRAQVDQLKERFCASDTPRARCVAFGGSWSSQQAGRITTWNKRNHLPDSSWTNHEEDGGWITGGVGEDGRKAGGCHSFL